VSNPGREPGVTTSHNHQAATKAAALYFRESHSLRHYAEWKIRLDPAYRLLGDLALCDGIDRILDVGCGPGVLVAYMIERGFQGVLEGFDPDEEKISIACRSVRADGVSFAVGRAQDLPDWHGSIVALDVIHYLSPSEREMFFRSVKRALREGDRAWVRLTVADSSWRYRWTRLEEWFVRASGWIPLRSHSFPTRREVESLAAQAGLQFDLRPMWGITPFNSYLLTLSC